MIKMTRRGSLKVLSVAGLTAAIPSLTQARLLPPASDSLNDSQCDTGQHTVECTHPQADIDLTIRRTMAKQPSEDYALVEIRNHSNENSTLRSVYPGVVEMEGDFYDLDSLLTNGELTLRAKQTVYRRLLPLQYKLHSA